MSLKPIHVLLIEDDRDLAANIIDFLEAEGHSVDSASGIRSAEKLIGGSIPEVMIVDRRLLADYDDIEVITERGAEAGAFLARQGVRHVIQAIGLAPAADAVQAAEKA